MAAIKIRVGVGLDAGVASAFQPIVAASRKVRTQVEAELGAIGKKATSVYRTSAQEGSASAERAAAAQAKAAKKSADEWQKFFEQQRRGRAAAEADALRSAERQAQATMKAAANAGRYFASGVRTAGRFAMDIARGAGLNVDPSSLIRNVVETQDLVNRIVNAGYVEGAKGPAGVHQDPKQVMLDVQKAADAGAISFDKAAAGLDHMVKKSSDLALSRKMLADISKFALATGADFETVAANAGDIVRKFAQANIEATPEMVMSALMTSGRQGKLGAIDFSEASKVLGASIGQAGKFASGPAGAMAQLGVMLQQTKGSGLGVAQSATAVNSFVSYLTSHAGYKNLTAGGLKREDIMDKSGKFMSLDSIIATIFQKTGGDPLKMGNMFRNQRAQQAAMAFKPIYEEAEKKQKGSGAAAIKQFFKDYGASMSQTDIDKEAALRMGDTKSQVQLLNNQLEKVAEAAAGKLLPALLALSPYVVEVAKGFGDLAVFVATNPLKAGLALLAASLVKTAATTGMSGGGAPLSIAAAAVTMTVLGMMAIDKITADAVNIETKQIEDKLRKEDTAQTIKAIQEGRDVTPKALEDAKKREAELSMRISAAKETTWQEQAAIAISQSFGGIGQQYIESALGGASSDRVMQRAADRTEAFKGKAGEGGGDQMQAMATELASIKSVLAGPLKITGTVAVSNQPGAPGGAPAVDHGNRTGPG